jgi:hypothetical protein
MRDLHWIWPVLLAGPLLFVGYDRAKTFESSPLLLRRIHAEFLEMPGLSLTVAQAARLFDVAEGPCARVLCRLGEEGLLRIDPNGRWRRSG